MHDQIGPGLLVNNETVLREPACGEIRHFHVELDSHDLLLAEGAPSESFEDDNSRGVFHNVAQFHAAHPGEPNRDPVFCAPRVVHGLALEKVLALLRQNPGGLAA